jgi:GntR family transcriptional regulator/MocR family aminotransferase
VRFKLEKNNPTPLYRQIERFFTEQIQSGTLSPGTRLPSNRSLASALGTSRIVVANAYAELESQGLVYGRQGSGTFVAPLYNTESKRDGNADSQHIDWPVWQQELLSHSWQAMHVAQSWLLSSAYRPGLISFAERIKPDPLWPVNDLRKSLQTVIRHDGVVIGERHDNTIGYYPLREIIAQILTTEGISTHPGEVLITSGSQQALNLVARVLLKPGDLVLVESPTYNVAIDLFRFMDVRLIGVPVDEQGMQTDRVEQILQSTPPRLIYTIPTFHNPTGSCMSGNRRRQLVSLADRYNIPILEDDYIGNIRFEGSAEPALKALDPGGRVIYAASFSKLLIPSLRIGFLVASGPVFDHLVRAKYVNDLSTSDLLQKALREFISVGKYHSHLRRVSKAYRKRRDTMLSALSQHLPQASWFYPKGGGFVWLTLPDGLSSDEFFTFAAAEGVTFIPGSFFYPGQRPQSNLSLNYANTIPDEIEEGILRLQTAFHQFCMEKDKNVYGQ